MKGEKNKSNKSEGQQTKDEENRSGEHPFNPFDKSQNTSSDRNNIEEEANAEQQRKETLTERD